MMPLKDLEQRRKYHREYMKRYLSDPDNKRRHLERVGRNRRKHRDRVQCLIFAFRSGGCELCDEVEECCLDAHHLGGKDFSMHEATKQCFSLELVAAELAKCVCLCACCHRKVHAGRLRIRYDA